MSLEMDDQDLRESLAELRQLLEHHRSIVQPNQLSLGGSGAEHLKARCAALRTTAALIQAFEAHQQTELLATLVDRLSAAQPAPGRALAPRRHRTPVA